MITFPQILPLCNGYSSLHAAAMLCSQISARSIFRHQHAKSATFLGRVAHFSRPLPAHLSQGLGSQIPSLRQKLQLVCHAQSPHNEDSSSHDRSSISPDRGDRGAQGQLEDLVASFKSWFGALSQQQQLFVVVFGLALLAVLPRILLILFIAAERILVSCREGRGWPRSLGCLCAMLPSTQLLGMHPVKGSVSRFCS
jgi:hypothetical protein